jgi:hypothetical protein
MRGMIELCCVCGMNDFVLRSDEVVNQCSSVSVPEAQGVLAGRCQISGYLTHSFIQHCWLIIPW